MLLRADSNVTMRGDKSFANDLDVQRGIVSGRVALLLRCAEIKPLLSGLSDFFRPNFEKIYFSLFTIRSCRAQKVCSGGGGEGDEKAMKWGQFFGAWLGPLCGHSRATRARLALNCRAKMKRAA